MTAKQAHTTRIPAGYMRCSHYAGRERCMAVAAVWILGPDGDRVPGCWYCRPHAEATVTEYAEKLGEHWSLETINYAEGR